MRIYIRIICCAFMAVLLSVSLSVSAGAAAGWQIPDGLLELPEFSPREQQQGRMVILPHVYGDGMFFYTFSSGRSFAANIPNGGIADRGVQITVDRELIVFLVKDGATTLFESGAVIFEDGHYQLMIISPMVLESPGLSDFFESNETPGPDMSEDETLEEILRQIEDMSQDEELPFGFSAIDVERTVFSFRIVTGPTRDIPVFNVPAGFEFESISLDGMPVAPTGKRNHRFARDGEYLITLKDQSLRAPNQFVRLTVARTPPIVLLDGATRGFSSSGPVAVSAGDGIELTILRNNAEIAKTGRYTQNGRYTVIARDAAGNVSATSFEITFSLPRSLVLTVILALLIGGVGYVIWARHSMKI